MSFEDMEFEAESIVEQRAINKVIAMRQKIEQLEKALAVAMEALEWYSLIHDKKPKVTVDSSVAKSSLASIKKLGEGIMSEFICDCGERCHDNLEVIVAERDRLKAENSKLKEFDWQNAMIDLTAERDAWKQKAEKLAELVMHHVAFKFTDPQGNLTELITLAQEIAEFEKKD